MRQLCGQKCLVDVRGEWTDWFEMTERQQKLKLTTHYNQGMQKDEMWYYIARRGYFTNTDQVMQQCRCHWYHIGFDRFDWLRH